MGLDQEILSELRAIRQLLENNQNPPTDSLVRSAHVIEIARRGPEALKALAKEQMAAGRKKRLRN